MNDSTLDTILKECPRFRILTSGITLELVRNHVRGSVWIVSAAAQRVNADANVESCIKVGMQKYWRGLAAGTYFAGRRLNACFGVIHDDIVRIWNFRDDDQNESFKKAIFMLVQDLADSNGHGPGSDITSKLQSIKAGLDVATPMSAHLAPAVAAVGLSVMFVGWLSEMYSSTPGVLRCLMGYIVDVTIVLEVLFWFKVAQPHRPLLCQEDIDAAFGLYRGSASHVEVHQQIRHYVDNMTLLDHVNPDDKTHIEVERLIGFHRRILIDTIFFEAKKGSDLRTASPTEVQSSPPNNVQPPAEASSSSDPPARQSQPKHTNTKTERSASTPKKKPLLSRLFGFFGKKSS